MHPENEQETTIAETEETSSPQSETEGGVEFVEPDFSEIAGFDAEPAEAPAVEAAEETPETPPEETPAEESAEAAESESVEEVVEEQPAEAAEAPKEEAPKEAVQEAPQQPEVKMPTKEELQGMYEKHREETLPELEKIFQLSDEDAAALDEQPSKVIPKLAGQMMYDTMLSTYNAVLSAMPSVVNRLIHASTEASSAQKQFYDAWPDLAAPETQPVVSAAIRAYRSANPQANLEDVIQKAGVMAMINLGKDPMASKKAAATSKPKPKAPPKPAGARNTSQVAPPKPKGSEEGNMFAELAEAYEKTFG